jgi:hypothetical protein
VGRDTAGRAGLVNGLRLIAPVGAAIDAVAARAVTATVVQVLPVSLTT